jgi:flavodoxin/ferredoxin
MKCAVVYFSQTGNTEKIAHGIGAGIAQADCACDVIKLKDADPHRLHRYDLLGFGGPVFGTAPKNVLDFVDALWSVGGKHAFGFCTHGGVYQDFFPSLVPPLRNKGLTVIGTRDWYGNCYLLHHIEPYPTAGHPDEIDLEEAAAFGREMVERSIRISQGETDLIPEIDVSLSHETGGDLVDPSMRIIDAFPQMLKYDKEKCRYPRCRLCMDNCPVYGIDLSVEPPVLADPCLNCEFCARICPTGALDMDEWVVKLAEITDMLTKEIILPGLDKAEEQGRFRRLLPKEELDPEIYGYMLHKKHPQWRIGKGAAS